MGDDSELQISMKGSPIVPFRNSFPTSIIMQNNWIPDLRSISTALKTSTTIFDGEFIGKVAQLKAEPNLEERRDGEIVFSTSFNDQRVKAHIKLSPEKYQLAGEAHLAGRKIICDGQLNRIGNRKEIVHTRFELLD